MEPGTLRRRPFNLGKILVPCHKCFRLTYVVWTLDIRTIHYDIVLPSPSQAVAKISALKGRLRMCVIIKVIFEDIFGVKK